MVRTQPMDRTTQPKAAPEPRLPIVRCFLAISIVSMTTIANAQNPEPEPAKISARIEAKATNDCINAKFFLKNEGPEPIEIVYGRGGMGQDVVPEFHTRYLTITPSIVKRPGRRSMMADILTIPPGKEVEYGTYVLTNPFVSGIGMVDTKEEYIQGYFVYREGKSIGRPTIDVSSNKIPLSEIAPKKTVERKPGSLFPRGGGMSGSPNGADKP